MTLPRHNSLLPAEPVTLVRAAYLCRRLNYYVELSNGVKGTIEFDSLARQQPIFAEIIRLGYENEFYVSGDQLRWENGAKASIALIRSRMKPSLNPTREPLTIHVAPQPAVTPKPAGEPRSGLNAKQQAQMVQFSKDLQKQMHRQQLIQNINLTLLATLCVVLLLL